ncbi:MAG TPA: VacJ family lipoprotein [Candidatus Dormibacteraeota bacterium]|nr:VacJ family lipoprotein [Candidatus Dormibacteraeota bacterium]
MTRVSVAALLLLLLGACATAATTRSDPRDPWERMNRATYAFNDKFDKAIFRPVARGYRNTVPHFVQTRIRNAFDNVDTTIVMLNDLLQGQLTPFMHDTSRLLVNTVIGVGGLFDPATAMGLEKGDRDFGQTIGKWGVQAGPYLVLPFLGPGDVRDTFGRAADVFSTPRAYISNTYWNYGSWLLEKVDWRSRYLEADRVLDSAYDPYAFLRNAYLQNRAFKVRGGNSQSEEDEEQKMLEESGIEPTPQQPPKPPQEPRTPR